MLPAIREVVTVDGIRIACHVVGDGPPLVMLFPYHVNHLELNWQVPLHRSAIEYFARYFSVVNLDFRGAGLSARNVGELSQELFCEDIRAVMTELAVERAAFCAIGESGVTASHFAAMYPGRVAAMIFVQGGESETNRLVLELRRHNPGVEAGVRGALVSGIEDKKNARALSEVARRAVDVDSLERWGQLLKVRDRFSIASTLVAPALCVHAAGDELVTSEASEALRRSIPGAVSLSVAGASGMAVWRDREALETMTRFVARSFGLDKEVHLSQRRRRRARTTAYPAGLSEREVEVLRLVESGHTNQHISEQLFVSPHTVSYHLRNIYAKTGTANRTEASAFAHRHGLTS